MSRTEPTLALRRAGVMEQCGIPSGILLSRTRADHGPRGGFEFSLVPRGLVHRGARRRSLIDPMFDREITTQAPAKIAASVRSSGLDRQGMGSARCPAMPASPLAGQAQTVLGPIAGEAMGITLPHEHLCGIGSSGVPRLSLVDYVPVRGEQTSCSQCGPGALPRGRRQAA